MVIIPFRPLTATQAAAPDALEHCHIAQRVLAEQTGAGGVIDMPALMTAASMLAPSEFIDLSFRRGRRAWQMRVGLGSTAPAAPDLGDRLDALLMMLGPGGRFSACEPDETPSTPILSLVPEGRTHQVQAGEDIAVYSPLPGMTDLGTALKMVNLLGGDNLSIRLSPRALSTAEYRLVELAIYQLQAAGTQAAQMPREFAEFLKAWRHRERGFEAAFTLTGVPEAAPGLVALSLALFGAPPGPRQQAALDLRLAIPAGEVPPWTFSVSTGALTLGQESAAPADYSAEGDIRLGENLAGEAVGLLAQDRPKHVFVLGGTGTGKTTLLENLIQQDIEGGEGVILIDPHGDLADAVAARVPPSRRSDLMFVDPSSRDCPFRLDLFGTPGDDPEGERNRAANQLVSFFRQMNAHVPEAVGPVFETYFRNAFFLLMLAPDPADRTILNFERVFSDDVFRHRLAKACPDPAVLAFWTNTAGRPSGEAELKNVAPYIISKLNQMTGSPMTRRFLAPDRQTLDFGAAMDEGRIVIVKLSKGMLGEYDCRFLGALLLLVLTESAMRRGGGKSTARRASRVYVDEFQNLASASAADLLAECRKFGVSLTLANQSLSQLGATAYSANVALAALANCGTLLSFRLGLPDACVLAPFFGVSSPEDFLRLGTGELITRRLDRGAPQPARHLFGSPPLG